ncbi:Matrixin family protein [Theobroma cacao]|uniref:Matrixin family protein n=1 Tax=Theobroma cacao TaxID=3641 RepID=A0A061EI19_THECC|nr:Matrixin family protein [Theobroma cacao]
MAPKPSHQVFEAIFLFLVLQPFVVKSRPLEPESLRNLERAQKGDTLNGLSHVKKYLRAFGYYPNDFNLIDDHFDDSLESALKAHQQNYYLKVTGKIDPDTIKAMMTPRCGVPDIISNRTSNDTGETPHGVIFHLVISSQVLRPIIARAFQTWAAVSPFRFQEVAQGNRADIRIGFYRYEHGDGYPFDGPGNILAHAFAPQDGRFHYDADENWSPNPTAPNQIDLETVAVHEIGHNLGLGHSQDQAAIMFPSLPAGATKRNLGQDDIVGLQALYGY